MLCWVAWMPDGMSCVKCTVTIYPVNSFVLLCLPPKNRLIMEIIFWWVAFYRAYYISYCAKLCLVALCCAWVARVVAPRFHLSLNICATFNCIYGWRLVTLFHRVFSKISCNGLLLISNYLEISVMKKCYKWFFSNFWF